MATRLAYAQGRHAIAIRRRGVTITLRLITRANASDPAVNPPRTGAVVELGASVTPGAASLVLTSAPFVGKVVIGDAFTVGGTVYTATADATAANNLVTVPVTPLVVNDMASGRNLEAVTWLNDAVVAAMIQGYARRLVDGKLIEERDLQVTVAASGLARAPQGEDHVILPDGDVRRVVTVTPGLVDGIAAFYTLQVR